MFACRRRCADVAIRGERRSREARTTKGSLLARHRSMPSFMNSKRSRLITIAAAGTLTLATAISAAAATLPTGSAAGAADAHMLAQTVHVDTLSLAQRQVSF